MLVYIHGGGYVYGNPRNWPFDHWIHQSPNVVIASVYYRLNSIGFLSTPELENHGLGDLNAGFYDQIQALKWIQQHVDAFGGDPRKVTINGQSAGGASIELHLVSHGSQGLFSQAIAQSVYRTPLPLHEQQVVSSRNVDQDGTTLLTVVSSLRSITMPSRLAAALALLLRR